MKRAQMVVVAALLLATSLLHAQQIRINEFMASNAATIADEDGDYPDWIELYNAGSSTLNLEGYGLSDDPAQPYRWVFPQQSIGPNQFMLIFASGKDRRLTGQPLHTNFSISAAGETLLLSGPSGQRIDSTAPVALQTDISYGRLLNNPETWKFFKPSSPGGANAASGYGLLLNAPVFSHESGFYTAPLQLSISGVQSGAQLVYSMDGSEPGLQDSVYSQPITIQARAGEPNTISMIPTNNNPDPGPPYYEGWQPPLGEVFKINVIRARQLHPDAPPGPIITNSFLIDPVGNQRYSLPMFSLVTDAANLFDPEIGIYVAGNHNNFFQDGPEWERPASLSLIENNGSVGFNQDIGIRTHGNTTRSRPRKSLRINARSEYGNNWIDYRLFPDKNTASFKRFILRNSGNDWDQAIFRDALLQSLMRNMMVERQFYRPAVVFINGEYWGIHNVRDRYDEHYIFTKFGLAEHEITIMENNAQYKFGNQAGVSHYTTMRSFVSGNNLALDQHYATLQTMIDAESFTDFQIAHIYAMNTDWPGNNTLYWRYIRDGYDADAMFRDGRWRWMLLDMDFGFGLNFNYVPGVGSGASHNTLAFALAANGPSWPNPPWSTFLLRNLIKNEQYKQHFINRFCDLLNTDLRPERVVAAIDSVQNLLQPEMQEHINRWRRPTSMSSWLSNVQVMRSFALVRASYMRHYIKAQFNLGNAVELTVKNDFPERGSVKINSVESNIQIWKGQYFPQIPLRFTAIPKPGFRFVGWEGASNAQSESVELSLQQATELTAVFETSNDFTGDSLNPAAWRLANGPFRFTYWDPNKAEREFPPHMLFLQSSKNDPGLNDPMTRPYHIPPGEYHADDAGSVGFPYRLTRRTRLNGLGSDGISFINTGRGRDLGAAVAAVDSRGLENITVGFTAGTLIPNSRKYAIRLQYRTGLDEDFRDVTFPDGQTVEYERNIQAGHHQIFAPVTLPPDANNQPYLQLRWKYYYTGQQINSSDGSRDMLRLDDIVISTLTMGNAEMQAKQKTADFLLYPNPSAGAATVELRLNQPEFIRLTIYNHLGIEVKKLINNHLSSGVHLYALSDCNLKPGIYICILETKNFTQTKKLLIVN